MLVFIVPLRSKTTAASWEKVSQLLERCLKSLCNQTIPNFRVIVVCHERPIITFEHPFISYVEVDFAAPNLQKITTNNSLLEQDKNRKIFTGIIQAKSLKPSHIMIVDADDCVSKRIAEFVQRNNQCDGWFIDRGYEYPHGTQYIYLKRKNFHRKCGTCYIVKYEILYNFFKDKKLNNIDQDFWQHKSFAKILEKRDTLLNALPFEGAIYVMDHGDNIFACKERFFNKNRNNLPEVLLFYIRRILKRLNSKLLSSKIRNEFGLYDLEV